MKVCVLVGIDLGPPCDERALKPPTNKIYWQYAWNKPRQTEQNAFVLTYSRFVEGGPPPRGRKGRHR